MLDYPFFLSLLTVGMLIISYTPQNWLCSEICTVCSVFAVVGVEPI